ncbi:hypothetical protein DSM104443_02559 [Usitatibacter rugosus]|uniref:Phosphoglycerate mutase n=1 Tax=Usitatibacter rugosus TaxID=2732067 RepID=A0A6M4GWW3_9PROT|nr:hypothetical protein [Usitatibacter rugosus]QJR11482.1 hypothetical protein DSM104443_02559 [Usitatibacter rugosus]
MREARLPALEKWLARADLSRVPGRGAYAWLAEASALPSPPPYAAVALAGEAEPREGPWMRADPVHLRINRDLVSLYDASTLDLSTGEAEVLAAALQALFKDDDLEFVVPAPERWYVRIPGDMPVTTPLDQAVGRDIFGLLPNGGSLNWRSFMTEAQMVLSNHDVNARREVAGQPAVNSVWFWGEGTCPPNVVLPFDRVVAGEPFARGLARLGGVPAVNVPGTLAELPPTPKDKDTLVVLDDLVRPFRRGDPEAWLAIARSLDERWFASLGDVARQSGGLRLILPGEKDTVVATLAPSTRWRMLRTRKSVSHHA